MTDLLVKLNYKGQGRIAVINAEEGFLNYLSAATEEVIIDKNIDPRYPYRYMIFFVESISEVEHMTPIALHNLTADGILWFCYPKKRSKKYKTDLSRDHGWKSLSDASFRGTRIISVDDNWSAIRFRNVKYIKSSGSRPHTR